MLWDRFVPPLMIGCTAGVNGRKGLVPRPLAGEHLSFLRGDGTWQTVSGAGLGDCSGPTGATDNAVARFNGTGGKNIENSGVIIDDSNNVTGVASLVIGTNPGGSEILRVGGSVRIQGVTISNSSDTLVIGNNLSTGNGTFSGNLTVQGTGTHAFSGPVSSSSQYKLTATISNPDVFGVWADSGFYTVLQSASSGTGIKLQVGATAQLTLTSTTATFAGNVASASGKYITAGFNNGVITLPAGVALMSGNGVGYLSFNNDTPSNSGTIAGHIITPTLNVSGNLVVAGTGTSSFAGLLSTVASATGSAGLRIPHGAAPTTPTNGDIWTTTVGLFVRINGVTKTVTLT